MGQAGSGPVDKSKEFGRLGRPGPVDKNEGLGKAGPAQAQPIEVRGFGVTGPGPAGPPSLANPHMSVSDVIGMVLASFPAGLVVMAPLRVCMCVHRACQHINTKNRKCRPSTLVLVEALSAN